MLTLNRLLVVNTYGIGDVLFTLPMLTNLRNQYPQAHITYMANARTADFLKYDPKINDVLIYERDEWAEIYRRNPISFLFKWLGFIQKLRQDRFDLVIDCSMNSTFGWLWILADIKWRLGFDFRGRGWALNKKMTIKGFEGKHVIEYYLDLLKLLDVPCQPALMTWPEQGGAQSWLNDFWNKYPQAKDARRIILVPGGGQSWGNAAHLKRWSAESFKELTDKIIEELGAIVILVGSKSEESLAKSIIDRHPKQVINLIGQTSLLEMAAIFKTAKVVIANDGGPLHVAVANGIPTVSIFGPVDPIVYGPYPPALHRVCQASLPCQPCYRSFRMSDCDHLSCLRQLSVDYVYRKVNELL